jgi:hypothetical protein
MDATGGMGRAALAVAFAALSWGCVFAPNLGDGDVRCGAGDSCPPGQRCGDDGRCHRGTDAGADLSVAVPVDGGICSPLHCSIGWCGPVDDGCGKTLDCGSCNPTSEPDLSGGAPPADMAACVPTRACVPGLSCGTINDGCGTLLHCGDCAGDNRACSESQPNECTCVPRTCASVNATCGRYPSGCNQVILICSEDRDLGCPAGTGTCGGGGAYTCGTTLTCNPLPKCPAKACGQIPDGCSGFLRCGACPTGQVCGGGGRPNVCG